MQHVLDMGGAQLKQFATGMINHSDGIFSVNPHVLIDTFSGWFTFLRASGLPKIGVRLSRVVF